LPASLQTSDLASDLVYLIFSHDPTLGSAVQVYPYEPPLIDYTFVLIKLHLQRLQKVTGLTITMQQEIS
jgi:hypothetical protein